MDKNKISGIILLAQGIILDAVCILSLVPILSMMIVGELDFKYPSDSEEIIICELVIWIILSIAASISIYCGKNLLINGTYSNNIANKNISNSDSNASIFINCPKCLEANSAKNTHCFKCGATLKPVNHTTNNESSNWICPKCGKSNSSYVGTCGCGQVKP